jgi:lysophospholipase L1-like esterase
MIRHPLRAALAVVAVLVAALSAGVATASGSAGAGTHYYVALGDSLAEGYQPNGDVGHGYADQLYDVLKGDDKTLELENLACGGETTSSMISGVMPWGGVGSRYFCGYRARSAQLAHGSQLADALDFLHAHRQFVSLITIDIGGNDVLTGAPLPTVAANLSSILDQLRDAAGPEVPIVGMNYYHPFLPEVWSATHDVSAVQAEADSVAAFNDFLEGIYSDKGDPYADVERAFQVTDTTLVDTDGNGTPDTPLDVTRVCAWTWMCSIGDLHPNTAGYGVMAQAFLAALP